VEVRGLWVMYCRAVREVTRVVITTVLVPLVLPLFMLLIFARVFASVVDATAFSDVATYSEYITPAVVLMATMLGSPTAGISTAVELQTGFFDRMRASPLQPRASLLARRLADGTRLALFAVVLLVAAYIDGVAVANWPLALALSVALGAWWGVAYGGLALSVCLCTASAETAQALVPLFFPVLFMSTAFMPMDLLPHWLQAIAEYNPVSYICDAIRAGIAGDFEGGAVWRAALGIAAVQALTQALVWRGEARLRSA
jgi:ABC-2 type transport system permease protein